MPYALTSHTPLPPNVLALPLSNIAKRQMIMHPVISLFILSLFIVGCAEERLYQNPGTGQLEPQLGQGEVVELPKKTLTISQILKYFTEAVPADVLFVIDNSGSMQSHQQRVIDNMNAFINKFSQLPDLNWKLGLLSSDSADAPYIGFQSPLDSSNTGAATLFADAVSHLGIAGSGQEKLYDPIKNAFEAYPAFNRSNALLDLVFITDTDDQSTQNPMQFYDYLKNKFGSSKSMKTFGVYNQGPNFVCPNTDDLTWSWASSHHKGFMDLGIPTKIYQLCDVDFGNKLLELANDLVLNSAKSEIQLEVEIIRSSLRVQYGSKILVDGLDYTYNETTRIIHFPNLSFATEPGIPVYVYYSQP